MQRSEYLNTRLKLAIKKNKNPFNETKQIIRSLKIDLPVLSTIVDYAGESSVGDILDIEKKINPFDLIGKILIGSQQPSNDHNKGKKCVSFHQYKSGSSKDVLPKSNKNSPKKNFDASIIFQMTKQLKDLKKQMLSLPILAQGTRRVRTDSDILLDKSISSNHNLQVSSSNTKQRQNKALAYRNRHRSKNYSTRIGNIISQLDAPELRTNKYIMECHDKCMKLTKIEQQLKRRYQIFENMGSPPKKLITLADRLNCFEKNIYRGLNEELVEQFSKANNKRYNLILKHEEQIRKMNRKRLQDNNKKQKIQQCRTALIQSANNSDLNIGFKLNSKGKQVYINNKKRNI